MKNILLTLILFLGSDKTERFELKKEINFFHSLVYDKSSNGLKNAFNSSIQIFSMNQYGISSGTGNLLRFNGQDIIITANHVIKDNLFLIGYEKNNNKIGLTVIFEDPIKDIAILKPNEPTTVTDAVLFRQSVKGLIGSKVYHCGHPVGTAFNTSDGMITSITSTHYIIDSFSLPGTSGSVVFDEDGRVVGVILSIFIYEDHPIPNIVLVTPLDFKYLSNSLK